MEYCPYGQLYEVLRDGKEIPVVLGQGQMLPDFEKGLKGIKAGDEKTIDYARMMGIVCDPKFEFSSYVGIEFEGEGDSREGIRKTKELLERLRTQLAAA